jgi:CheY-like chemotaxis protein
MPVAVDKPIKGRVLAVDDCEAMLQIVCASLESFGYDVQAVDSGWAALDAARQAPFDAIVLDVEMPGPNGMAVGRALREDPRTASAMIAMHSSVGEAAVRAGFDQFDAFVPKASHPRALGERVDSLLRDRQR